MEAQGVPAGRPFRRRPIARAVEGDHEALETAPGIPHAEQGEAVEHGGERLVRARLQDHGEQAGRSLEVALPDLVARVSFESRMDDLRHLRPGREPAGHLQGLLLMLLQAQGHGAQPAQPQEDILRAGAHGEGIIGVAQGLEAALVGGNHAEQEVRAAAEILGAGLDGDVDPPLVRREEEGGCPGVVHEDHGSVPVRYLGNGRNILHLKGLGTGGFRKDSRRVRPHQGFDPGPDPGIVVGGFHTKFLQRSVTEVPGRQVDRVRHQQVIAGLETRHEPQSDGGKARRCQHRSGCAGKLRPGRFECFCRGCALGSIGITAAPMKKIVGGWIKDGRAPVDRRIHETVLLERLSAGMDKAGTIPEVGWLGRKFGHGLKGLLKGVLI